MGKQPIISSPAADNEGTIYFGSYDNYLYAVRKDGSLKWRLKTEYKISSSSVVGREKTVYIGSWDGHLYGIKQDGRLR